MDESPIQRELRRLSDQVAGLSERVARLEQGRAPQPVPAPGALNPDLQEVSAGHLDGRFAETFARLALVCFGLLGALVLRVATQRGWWAPALGTGLGLAYCGLLVLGPAMVRDADMARHSVVLQVAGLVLAPLIILESFHRIGSLGGLSASGLFLTLGWVAAVVGGLGRRRSIALVGLVAGVVGLAGLGIDPEVAVVRGAMAASLVLAALLVAHWRSWSVLRSSVLLPVGALLGLAILASAHREGLPPAVAPGLLACALAVWWAVVANHGLRARRLTGGEALWLPLATAWAASLAMFYRPDVAAAVCLVAGFGLLAFAFWAAWERARPTPGLLGVAAAGAAAAGLGALVLDTSGLSVAAVALITLLISLPLASDGLYVLSWLIALVAGGTGLVRGILAQPGSVDDGWTWAGGLVLGGLLIGHRWLVSRAVQRGPVASRWLSWLVLLLGVVVWFSVPRGIALRWLGPGAAFQFATSVLLTAGALASLLLGRRLASRALTALGYGLVGLLAVKVAFFDLFGLSGLHLLGSVLCLGGAFLAASLVLHARKVGREPEPPAPAGERTE